MKYVILLVAILLAGCFEDRYYSSQSRCAKSTFMEKAPIRDEAIFGAMNHACEDFSRETKINMADLEYLMQVEVQIFFHDGDKDICKMSNVNTCVAEYDLQSGEKTYYMWINTEKDVYGLVYHETMHILMYLVNYDETMHHEVLEAMDLCNDDTSTRKYC